MSTELSAVKQCKVYWLFGKFLTLQLNNNKQKSEFLCVCMCASVTDVRIDVKVDSAAVLPLLAGMYFVVCV